MFESSLILLHLFVYSAVYCYEALFRLHNIVISMLGDLIFILTVLYFSIFFS